MIWRSNKRWPIFLLRHRSWGHCHFVGYCIPLTQEETGGDLACFFLEKRGDGWVVCILGEHTGIVWKKKRMNSTCTVDAMWKIVCRCIISIISIIHILHHLHYTCIWYDPSCVFCTTVFFRRDRPIIDSKLGQQRNSFRAAWNPIQVQQGSLYYPFGGNQTIQI